MRIQRSILGLRHVSVFTTRIGRSLSRRPLVTLAIETSCDDTSVAILEKNSKFGTEKSRALLHFHRKITANNAIHKGVHPLVALQSHQQNLANLVQEALHYLPPEEQSLGAHTVAFPARDGANGVWSRRRPDFISVTRGPGMRSNLSTGLDIAKGLAVAWQVDLVGVHHMQAHALTPRLVTALQRHSPVPGVVEDSAIEPNFPFLSVLASGGHTMLLHSLSLTDHKLLGSTVDIAIGECLDKIARAIIPDELLSTAKDTMYGAMLEEFAFPPEPQTVEPGQVLVAKLETPAQGSGHLFQLEDFTAGEYCADPARLSRYGYAVPKNGEAELKRNMTEWGWAFNQPLSTASGGTKNKSLDMSFSGLMTAVERAVRYGMDKSTGRLNKTLRPPNGITLAERKAMAQNSMRAVFEHLANRVVFALHQVAAETPNSDRVSTVVMSGGVAANRFLRYILASVLSARGYSDIRLVFPPSSLCTDNAAMIAWTGLEMYEAGYKNPLSIRAVRKWPLDAILSPEEDD